MKVLLHTCCAPCTTHCLEVLKKLGHEPTLFFANHNIFPEKEYIKRLKEILRLAEIAEVPMILEEPDHENWLKSVASGLEEEPEGGIRCTYCFKYALQKTYGMMQEKGLDAFTTTLTISPHKPSELITKIGKEISESAYLDINFKKQEGFKRSLELSEEYALYRQNYCGCEFSMSERM